MPEELKNITENVMEQIHKGRAKMKPKSYFIIGSILTFLGLISTFIVSMFLFGLVRFSLRTHWGRGAQYKLDQMLSDFPWWIIIFAIISLIIGIWLVRQYDFSYKKNPWIIISGFILAILFAGWIIDMSGINETMFRRGPMKGMMDNYFRENNLQGNSQRGMMRNNINQNNYK